MDTPLRLTLGQFAKQAVVSKSQISKWIKAGKLSAERQENGEFRIDPSELDRVPSLRVRSNGSETVADAQMDTPLETPSETAREREIDLLRELIEEKERTIRDKERAIEDIRQERDDWKKQAQQAQQTNQLLLTAGEKQAKRWWQWRR